MYDNACNSSKHIALCPQKQSGLSGTGTFAEARGGGGGGGERVKARPSRTDPEDRGGRGPPPEQWQC